MRIYLLHIKGIINAIINQIFFLCQEKRERERATKKIPGLDNLQEI